MAREGPYKKIAVILFAALMPVLTAGPVLPADVVAQAAQDLKSSDPALHLAAIETLGRSTDPRAVEVLLKYLTDWDKNYYVSQSLANLGFEPRTEAEEVHFQAARRHGQWLSSHYDQAREILTLDLESENPRDITNAAMVFIGLGAEDMVPLMIKRFHARGTPTLAIGFLNSGHALLEEAGHRWSKRHGYLTHSWDGFPNVRWGDLTKTPD